MSIHVLAPLWDNGPQDKGKLLVLMAIAECANRDGYGFPSLGMMARMSRHSVRQVMRIIQELECEGWLTVSRKVVHGKGNSYQLNLSKCKGDIVSREIGDIVSCDIVSRDIGDTSQVTLAEREERKKESNKERKREEKLEPSLEPSSVVFEACSLFADSELPEGVTRELWREYAKMRKCIRSPLTEYAEKQEVKNLWKLCHQGYNPVDVINQSITKSWRGLFPISSNGNGHGRGKTSEVDWEASDRYAAMMDEQRAKMKGGHG